MDFLLNQLYIYMYNYFAALKLPFKQNLMKSSLPIDSLRMSHHKSNPEQSKISRIRILEMPHLFSLNVRTQFSWGILFFYSFKWIVFKMQLPKAFAHFVCVYYKQYLHTLVLLTLNTWLE